MVKRTDPCSPISVRCVLLVVILLLAAGLRFYRLDAQSFWNDEGNSARLSERPVALILEGTASDIHPPVYYLLLHYWRALFGQSEFALRSLSVVAGLALVAFTYLLGRYLFGETTGLTAAFLGAISPFAVYYSQEARMYALLGALSLASTYLLLRVTTGRQIADCKLQIANLKSLFAYTLVAAAGLYTQYAFPFVLLVHNAIFVLWWLTTVRRSGGRWRWLALWVGAQVAVVVLYLPWLSIALQSVTGWPSAEGATRLGHALLEVLGVLSVGITLPVEQATAALVGAGALLLAGLVPRRKDRAGWSATANTAIYLLLPIVLIFAFDLYKPAWLKFLIVVLPPFHILVARGAVNLARWASGGRRLEIGGRQIPNLQPLITALVVIFLAAITFPSLRNLYFNPAYARDDYRQIAADIAAAQRPGDAVILNAPNQWEVFTYYYPDRDVYPAPYRPASDGVEAFLSPLIERYRRLFVLYWGDAESDPHQRIESWLATNAYKADDRWYGRVRLATYGTASQAEEPLAVALDVRFGGSIRLRGYAAVEGQFAPGDVLPVMLSWEALAPIPERYKVTVQLLDGAGRLVAQHDAEPVAGFAPTDTWEAGQAIVDRHGVLLPTDLPPGSYTPVVALYQISSGERLSVIADGTSVSSYFPLSIIEVRPVQ